MTCRQSRSIYLSLLRLGIIFRVTMNEKEESRDYVSSGTLVQKALEVILKSEEDMRQLISPKIGRFKWLSETVSTVNYETIQRLTLELETM